MTKAPLLPMLPKEYADSATKTAIYHALKPYESPGTGDIVNPLVRWDVYRAWSDAQEWLALSRWRYNDSRVVEKDNAEYELAADTDEETDHANIIIAGLVAFQFLHPESKISIHRIEHKRGGEMELVISHDTALELLQKVPTMQLLGYTPQPKRSMKGFLQYLSQLRK